MKVSELTGAALDWAVAKCEGLKVRVMSGVCHDAELLDMQVDGDTRIIYSTDWAQGGPIIEREGIAIDCLRCDGKIDGWIAALPMFDEAKYEEPSPTPLIAAMRCYVASKLGDEIELPEELK